MDNLTDEALATRIAELRTSKVLQSFMEKLTGDGSASFTAEENTANTRLSALLAEQDRRIVRAAYAQQLQQGAEGGHVATLNAKLDELLAANGPPRRALPGSGCDSFNGYYPNSKSYHKDPRTNVFSSHKHHLIGSTCDHPSYL
ncbi:hypothetical protein CYMTET_38880 [Cymbomonas tetramitiformis]|uniref:Uncharacterized protein n=1 Tax=Cymbomonas tetramitiformis TaxID=36881 RepID=A0AAE0CB56_9CHLO|nr:hypothetical protein CYMTET_38880 [Cymbomonas tetramitiformis]